MRIQIKNNPKPLSNRPVTKFLTQFANKNDCFCRNADSIQQFILNLANHAIRNILSLQQ